MLLHNGKNSADKASLLFAYLLDHAGVYHVTILKRSEACRKHSGPVPTPFGPMNGPQLPSSHGEDVRFCRVAVLLFATGWRLHTSVSSVQWTRGSCSSHYT